MTATATSEYRQFIGGKWVDAADGETFEDRDPYTGGVVATVPAADGYDIVGSAVSVFSADRTSCEFAITVASGFGGVGLAKTLMTALIDESRRRGVKDMEGFVLAQNSSMLGLARRLGFRIEREPGDASVRVCRLTLNPP